MTGSHLHPRRKLQPADHEGEEGEEMSEHEIILTDKIVKDWIEEIPNMRVATENYPGFSALAHAVVFEVLELSLLELVDLRTRIAELEAMTTWQPIETCPVETEIIVGNCFSKVVFQCEIMENRINAKWYTHWMPSPKPPEEK